MTATVDSLLLDIAIMRVCMAAGVRMADADFVEADHPREDDGKFTEAGGGGGGPASVKHDGMDYVVHRDPKGEVASVALNMGTLGHVPLWKAGEAITPVVGRVITKSKEVAQVPLSEGRGVLGRVDIEPGRQKHVHALFGTSNNAASAALGHGMPAGVTTTTEINATGSRVRFKSEFTDSSGTYLGAATRFYDPERNTVKHENLDLVKDAQGKGIASTYLKNSVDLYKKAGVARIDIQAAAANGGYTWARLGFVPNDTSWDYVKENLADLIPDLSPEHQAELLPILNRRDPKAIWEVADHPKGKELLCGNNWEGSFDLSDQAAYKRLSNGAGRKR